jgi:cell division protein FtsQ
VSVRGEVFAATYEGALPRFAGPEGTAAEMAAKWPAVLRAAEPLANGIAELRLSERRAWQAKLDSGLVIDLGRSDVEARLARFAAAWPLVDEGARKATHADLRYPNGFALRGVAPPDRTGAPKRRRA